MGASTPNASTTTCKPQAYATWRDTRSIDEYQDFSAEIEMEIKAAKCVVTCITPSIDDNPFSFVRREILYADSIGKPIIPCVFPNAIVSLLVNHLTWLPFFKGTRPTQMLDYDGGFAALVKRLPDVPESAPPRPTSDPYREYLNEVVALNQTVFALISLRAEAYPTLSRRQALPRRSSR